MTKHNETKLMETFAALMLSKAYQGVLTSELSAFPLDFNVSDQPVLSLNTEIGRGMTGADIRNGESVCILARRPKNLLCVQGGSSKMEFCALCLAVKKSLGNLTLVCLSLLHINEHLLFYYKSDCTLVST
jgi:hypothetical protein